jgi:ribose/xylose/arabinose/galactoside ABC-type transport system permease subunit/ABC-type branched-subunit amino acid transport system ATPase component
MGGQHIGGASRRFGLLALAGVLVAYFQWRSGNFVSRANFTAILVNTSSILLVSIAAARLLVAGALDLSIGGVYAICAVTSAIVARDSGSAALAAIVAVALGATIGAFNGVVVRLLRISPIIVTLGLAAVYRGLALLVTDARSVHDLPEAYLAIGRERLLDVPVPVYVALGCFVVGALALTRTVGGVRSYAVGGSADASRLVGIRVDRHRLLLFTYLGASVGLVALLATARLGSGSPTIGSQFEIDVLTAVILGGVAFNGGSGRPFGVFVGVVTIGILNSGMIFIGLDDFYQQIAKGVVLLAALAADQALVWARQRRPRSQLVAANGDNRFDDAIEPPGPIDPWAPVALECTDLHKTFGTVVAVDSVSLAARRGEVLCLVGDNGAGKSTVIKILSGAVRPDNGVVTLDGRDVTFSGPADARDAGIETVHQDLALCPNLGAAHNLVLGREPRRGRFGSLALFDRSAAVNESATRLAQVGVELDDLLRPVAEMSGGQRQIVAIARVVRDGLSVVILDEPTAALGVHQTGNVLRLTRTLAASGTAVVMISHDVESVLKVSDRVVVLKHGRVSYEGPTSELDARSLVHLMAGLDLTGATDGAIDEDATRHA